jgi:hypothetical protein
MDASHPFYQKLQNSKNVLLLKDEIGRGKKSIRDLPDDSYFYGCRQKKDLEGAGAVISSWQEHKPTQSHQTEKDFRRLNRMSLNQKLITAKQVSNFVKNNDVRVQDRRKRSSQGFRSYSGEYFGIRNRPSTPMGQIVCFDYGNEAVEEKKRAYQVNLSYRSPVKRNFYKEQDKSSKFKNQIKNN